jgi:hypothetical protein
MTTTRVFCRDRAAFAYSLLGAAVIASVAASSTTAKDEGSSPPLPPNPNSPDEAGDQKKHRTDDDARDDGPLDALFGTARRIAEQAAGAASGKSPQLRVQGIIEAAADGVRAGVSVVDDTLPPLDPKVARELGDTFRESVLASHKRITDRTTLDLLLPIWKDVLKAAKEDPSSFTFTVVDDPEVNAFAFVGRNVVVNKGFINFARGCTRTSDVIRFVLAHEVGHIVCGHTDMLFRRMVVAEKIVSGAGVAPGLVEGIIKNTPFNQGSELEADRFAKRLHVDNGWSLEGGREFFVRLQQMTERAPSESAIESLFSSHPDDARRLELWEKKAGR